MFLSVSYDIKYQTVARKHMATSRDKEHSQSRQQCTHTPPAASSSSAATTHSIATFSSTLGAAPVPKQRAVTTKSSQNIFTVFFFK